MHAHASGLSMPVTSRPRCSWRPSAATSRRRRTAWRRVTGPRGCRIVLSVRRRCITVTGTVSAKKLGVSSNATAGSVPARPSTSTRGCSACPTRHRAALPRRRRPPTPWPAPRAPRRRSPAACRSTNGASGPPRRRRRADRLHRRRLARHERRGVDGLLNADEARDVADRPGRRREARRGRSSTSTPACRLASHPATSAWAVDVTSTTPRAQARVRRRRLGAGRRHARTAPSSRRTARSTTPTRVRKDVFARPDGDLVTEP